MRLDKKIRTKLKLHNLAFVTMVLVISGLIAILSYQYNFQSDWTYADRNSLSKTSKALLLALDEAPVFTIYANESGPARSTILTALKQYQLILPDISVNYINPELEPDLIRELGIQGDTALEVTLKGKSEFISQLKEQQITNAIQRLARSEDRWLIFLDGHGERKPDGIANHDFGELGKQLTKKGIRFQRLKLSEIPVFPKTTAALVIASPQVNYLPGEISIIKKYIEKGGNLLWFSEPGDFQNLAAITNFLELEFLPGTVYDPYTQSRGINDPRLVIVSKYAKLNANDDFELESLYPFAHGIKLSDSSVWQSIPVMQSSQQSWSETGDSSGKQSYNEDKDIHGPLNIGVALVRDIEISTEKDSSNQPIKVSTRQRVLVVGDGDFLSNMYQGNVGNLDLGLRFVNWILHDDQFISIPARTAPDIKLQFGKPTEIFIGLMFLIVIPILLLSTGTRIWVVRRNR